MLPGQPRSPSRLKLDAGIGGHALLFLCLRDLPFFKEGIFYYALHLVYTLFFVISIFLGRELFFLPSLTPSFFHPIFFLCAPALHRHFFSKRKFPSKWGYLLTWIRRDWHRSFGSRRLQFTLYQFLHFFAELGVWGTP